MGLLSGQRDYREATASEMVAVEETSLCEYNSPVLLPWAPRQQGRVARAVAVPQIPFSPAVARVLLFPKAEQPAPPCVLLQLMPGASPPQLGRWGDSGGVMTGHHCPRVRMEEARLSAGTHQRPNQALAAGRKGRAG